MKPQYQLRKAPNGDCLRACIATLLEVDIEKVPDFTEAPDNPECPFPGWWLALQSWLSDRGLWFLEMHLTEKTPWMPIPLPALCIFFGETESGVKHAIVGRVEEDKFLPVFNPWPEAQLATGVGAIGFLIGRDPSTMVNMGRALERIERLTLGLSSESAVAKEIRNEASQCLGKNIVDGPSILAATLNEIGKS